VNANEIEFTYLEASKKFGITNSRFTRAIDDLIAKGFIEIVHHGGCYQKDKTRYGLSERWRRFNTPEFSAVSRPKDPVKRGYRKPKFGAISKANSTLENRAIEHANPLLSRVQCHACNVDERSHVSGMEREFKLHKNR
jgi:hypothetical protein